MERMCVKERESIDKTNNYNRRNKEEFGQNSYDAGGDHVWEKCKKRKDEISF